MNFIQRTGLICALLLLAGCGAMRPYEPPEDKAPQALVKLKYKYSEVVPGTTLGARMGIRHGAQSDDERFQPAFNQSYGTIASKKGGQEIPMAAVKVHADKKTDVTMAVYFYWHTTQTYTVMVNKIPQMQTQQVYHEKACTVKISFTPEAGKVYLLDYSSPYVDHDCSGHAYEQVKQRGDQFKLVKVGSSKVL
jgi:predicted small lipoprotein YifL